MTSLFTRIVSIGGLALALYYIAYAATVFQEIAAFIVLLIAAIMWVGGEIVDAIERLKAKMVEIEDGKCKEHTEG